MNILNIHERKYRASAQQLGALLDSLASPSDALWPKHSWPPMKFDRPLGVGARGGHGPIGYIVEEYSPGQSVKFRFTAPPGFVGHHCFQIEPIPKSEHTLLRHTISTKIQGFALIAWPLAIRHLHDALLEDALTTAECSLGLEHHRQRWSPWVRFLRWAMARIRTRKQLSLR